MLVNKNLLAQPATAKSGAFNSSVIQPGQSWRFVARARGAFPYTCSFHPMTGTLTVR